MKIPRMDEFLLEPGSKSYLQDKPIWDETVQLRIGNSDWSSHFRLKDYVPCQKRGTSGKPNIFATETRGSITLPQVIGRKQRDLTNNAILSRFRFWRCICPLRTENDSESTSLTRIQIIHGDQIGYTRGSKQQSLEWGEYINFCFEETPPSAVYFRYVREKRNRIVVIGLGVLRFPPKDVSRDNADDFDVELYDTSGKLLESRLIVRVREFHDEIPIDTNIAPLFSLGDTWSKKSSKKQLDDSDIESISEEASDSSSATLMSSIDMSSDTGKQTTAYFLCVFILKFIL